jgi:methyl-accepting chemotaxis protein
MKGKGIGFKIIMMAVSISAISAVIGIIGLYTTKQVSKLANNMYQESVLRIQYADDMQYTLQTIAVTLLNANLPGKTADEINSYKKQFMSGYSVFEEAVKNYDSTGIKSEERKQLLLAIKEAGKQYSEKGIVMFDYFLKGDLTGANKYGEAVLVPIRNQTLNPAVEKLVDEQVAEAKTAYMQSKQTAYLSVVIIVLAVLVGLGISLSIGFGISHSITKPVTGMVKNLSDSSGQIGISSTQLSSASQEIANGAQEQASSIEETTSSMEELSSMVRQNLENARQASLLAQKATEASQSGSDKMTEMLSAMNNISKSTEDIKNVIDVIDDIAFQTNMLALNAAVEAARAGEAGMGFAVVADEVKNLANRSSESAKETASMIKETLKNIESGMTISRELADLFKNDLVNSKKVTEMNKEVETASGQQSEGIDQVNKAMIQFDTVVQTNASSAEETASAAEELQGQVTSLNDIVDSLYFIVSGKTYVNKKVTGENSPVITKSRTLSESVSGNTTAGTSHRMKSTEYKAPEGTAAEPAAGKNIRQGDSVRSGTVKKENKAGTKAGADNGGHAISFEDDEDFRPV